VGVQVGEPDRAQILLSTGFKNTDVVVLHIDETGLPTVPIAKTAGNLTQGTTLEAIGFPGSTQQLPTGITEPSIAQAQVGAIRSGGGTSGQQIEVDAPGIEHGMSGGPVIDQDGHVVGLVSYGLILSGQNGKNYPRAADDIQSALSQAGKHPARGPVDTDFAAGMDRYWTQHYTTAAKDLNRVLAEDPGHTVATKYLRLATARQGTSADKDVGGGFKWWWILVIAAGVAAIAGLVFWLLRRRGKAGAPAAAAPAPTPPAPPVPAPVPPAPAAESTEPAIVVRDGSKAGERHPITNELSLGREKSDLVIDDPEISRSHAVLRAVDGGLEIKDVGSANGTFVNGTRIEANGAHRLNDGDLIKLGRTTLQVEAPKPVNPTVVRQTAVVPTPER
jgi:FHA domain/Trypsin-like peptidase domain